MKATFTPNKFVLLLLDAYGGNISGKTVFQKRAYFISILMGRELDYRPHYFGPYSPDIDEGISYNTSLGFIDEMTQGFGAVDSEGFEVKRYDYRITDDGKEIAKELKRLFSTETQQIREFKKKLDQAGDTGDYISLSIAAKTYFIGKRKGSRVTSDEIKTEANLLGWKNISEQAIEKAIDFLVKLDLATRN